MAQFRPAGLSDSDSDSDEYDFGHRVKPVRRYQPAQQQNARKIIEKSLQDAIINGSVEEVEKIIQNDLNNSVNVRLDIGWTPLMHACFHAQDKIVQLLLDKGADPNLHSDGVTSVMLACSNGSANNDTIHTIICSLIKKECILNIGDKYGQTPLMRAISSGRVAVVQILLENEVNIEMRDQQGWTALFWAVHHNQPEILEMLIAKGARLTEVDKSNRTPIDIADSHDYQNIIEILQSHLPTINDADQEKEMYLNDQISCWQDYYPGITKNGRPSYVAEIPILLYGMNCERLTPLINKSGIDLKSFLLLEESDMIKLGIEMPYERQRLKLGLRRFHTRGWKLSSVSGLYARKSDNYSVLDCLTTLGTHLQQVYILEATLQYALREFPRIQNQLKFEPPESPLLTRLQTAAKKMITNVNSIRREASNMKTILIKISRSNPAPADLIKDKTTSEIVFDYVPQLVIISSLGFLVYNSRTLFNRFMTK